MVMIFNVVLSLDIVNSLIDAAHDKNNDVRKDMSQTLYELGKRQPLLVLSSCHLYLNKHQKVLYFSFCCFGVFIVQS